MAERKITNNTILLLLGVDGIVYDTVVCLTKVGRDLKVDEVDATTVCGPDKSPGQLSGSVTFEGQHLLDAATGKVSGKELFDYLKDKTSLYWKIGPVTPVDGDIIKTGTGFINALSDNYQLNTQSTFSGNISIQGVPAESVYTTPGDTIPMTGLWAWYDAALGVTGTSTVTAWADQSGNARTLTATGGQEPALDLSVINSLPAISTVGTSGTKMLYTAANFPDVLTTGCTVFVVGSQDSVGGSVDSFGTWLGAGGFSNMQLRRGGTSSSGFGSIEGAVSSATTTLEVTAVPENTFVTVRLLNTGLGINSLCFNDGIEEVNISDNSAYAATPLTIFKTVAGSAGRKKMAEIIIYNRVLTAPEVDIVELYLQTKYAHY